MDETTQSNAKPDLSKTTLVVLVLLTLVISVIGTWSVLNEVNAIKIAQQPKAASGKVSLNIVDPNAPKASMGTTGNVALQVLEAK